MNQQLLHRLQKPSLLSLKPLPLSRRLLNLRPQRPQLRLPEQMLMKVELRHIVFQQGMMILKR